MMVANFDPFAAFETKRELTVENGVGPFHLPEGTLVRPSSVRGRAVDASSLLVDAYPRRDFVIYGVRIAVEDLEPLRPTSPDSSEHER